MSVLLKFFQNLKKKEHTKLILQNQHYPDTKVSMEVLQNIKCKIAISSVQFSSVHFSHSVVSDSLQPHESRSTPGPLSITISWSSLKLTFIESVMPSSHNDAEIPLCVDKQQKK